MDIFKLMGLSLVTTILCAVLRQYKKEYAIYVVIAAGTIFFVWIAKSAGEVFGFLNSLSEKVGIQGDYLKILFKITGISYVAEFTSSVCRDAGESAISVKVDLVARLIILMISLPVLERLLETVFSLG